MAILLWLPMFHGDLAPPSALVPLDWHVHEMLYGYVPAVVTGFLLTAIPNWTGRLPLQGTPLLVMVLTWLAGRIAVATSAWIGWAPAMLVDVAFLVLVAAAAAREIVAGSNWSNLKVVVVVSLLAAGNLLFHVEARLFGIADHAARLGIAATVTLIMLVGGRIIPSFTRNWLARRPPGALPATFGRFDAIAVATSAAALVLWVLLPDGPATAAALLVGAGLQAARLARWAGHRTFSDPLVSILHVGYAFVPLGFLLAGLAALGEVAASAGIHAWTGGAIGTMTLAVMTRATLGHTGRPLVAMFPTRLVYGAVVVSGLARIGAALEPGWAVPLLQVAAYAWATAFLGFAAFFGPALWRPRLAAAQP